MELVDTRRLELARPRGKKGGARSTDGALEVAALVLLFFYAALAVLAWAVLTRDGRRGWRRGWTAIFVAVVIGWSAIAAWTWTARLLSIGTRVCFDCGRSDRVVALAGLPCWRRTLFDGGDYRGRFIDAFERCDRHRWESQGGTQSIGGIDCRKPDFDDWFRELSQLSDRVLAQQLVDKSRAMPRKHQRWFMERFGYVVRNARSNGVPLETALADWQENLPPHLK